MTNKSPLTFKADFEHIYQLISRSKVRAWKQLNNTMISLYWEIGAYVSQKVEAGIWGQGVVEDLARFIDLQNPNIKGFSARNIWRMKKFYETYKDHEKLSTLLTEITWSNHLHILSKTKSIEEKEYYLNLSAHHHYSARELERLINSSSYERTMLATEKLSTRLTEFPKPINGIFKDSYVFEFAGLSEHHQEQDLRQALIAHLKQFLLELGPDFTLMGEEYPIQVGTKDFRIDLLMFHRGLSSMVAIELKSTEFQPAHLGQLEFYLEALDQNVKKPHENPSLGILICKTKDDEVVKYALNRSLSPAMIAEYETQLISKSLLQQKLHELSCLLENSGNDENEI